MDIRTGQAYPTKDDAINAGVPESDIAEVNWKEDSPIIRFSSGPFKNRAYKRNPITGQLVHVGNYVKAKSE